VAIKVLQSNLGTGSEALARFRREGVAACRVKHPNAVVILDFGITGAGVSYLVMELLEGRCLEDELLEEGLLSTRRTAAVMVPVCQALAEAHQAGIVHRDVKPSNIFLHQTPQGEVPKVLDFGIAKIVGEAALAQKLTVEGWVLGTPVYMAPERFRSGGYDGQSDVYSIGVTLYQMLVGQMPFLPPKDDPMAVMAMHVGKAPTPLRQLNPDVPEPIEKLVLRALKKRPENRPTAGELAERLTRIVAELGAAADGLLISAASLRAEPGTQAPGVVPPTAATVPEPLPPTDQRPDRAPGAQGGPTEEPVKPGED
jgi:serine/threonine protein kinase